MLGPERTGCCSCSGGKSWGAPAPCPPEWSPVSVRPGFRQRRTSQRGCQCPIRPGELGLHHHRAVPQPAGGPRLGARPAQAGGAAGAGGQQRGRAGLLPGLRQPDEQQEVQQLPPRHPAGQPPAAGAPPAGGAGAQRLAAPRPPHRPRDAAPRARPQVVLRQLHLLPAALADPRHHHRGGGSVRVLRGLAGSLGAPGLPPPVPEGGASVPPPVAGAGLALPQLHLHARRDRTPGSERDSAAAGGRPAGDGARGSEDRLCVPLWGPGRLPRGVGGGHDGAGGGVIRRGLRPGVCTSGQHRHELVGDEVPIQALSDRNGAGVDERGVRPGRVAALLPAGRPALPQPQLRGAPGRGGGGRDPGRGHAAELRAAAAGAVPLLDLRVRLRRLRALRHLLERLRLQPAGPQAPPPTVSREGWRLIFSPP